MRLPRFRFTIGRMLVLVSLAGLALWGVFIVRPRVIASEQQALASYKQAVLVREVAEYAVKEYEQGIYLQEKATYQGQIALARADLDRATDRLRGSSERREKGTLTRGQVLADQLAKQQADFDLEQAMTQLQVLEKFTKAKQVKSLRSDIEKARADELSKLATYQQERSRRWWRALWR